MAKRRELAVRRAVGPGWTGLLCLGCLGKTCNAMVAANSTLYLNCSTCRFKLFGLSARALAGFRWVTKLVEKPRLFEQLLKSQDALPEVAPPIPEAPRPAPVEAREGAA